MDHLLAAFILSIVFPSVFQTCIAANIPLNSIQPLELVNNNSTSRISSTGEASNIFTQCSASVVSWLGFEKPVPNTFVDNCKAADEIMQADIQKYGSTILEFVNRRGTGAYGLDVMRTPLKYTAGTYMLFPHSLSRLVRKLIERSQARRSRARSPLSPWMSYRSGTYALLRTAARTSLLSTMFAMRLRRSGGFVCMECRRGRSGTRLLVC